jgi:Tetratricopeptide repeat/TPR repeat
MRVKVLLTLAIFLIVSVEVAAMAAVIHGKKKSSAREEQATAVAVNTGLPQCKVDLDGQPEGMTGPAGKLRISEIEPGDHYLHIDCPGRQEVSRFLDLRRGEELLVAVSPTSTDLPVPAASGLGAAESKMCLRNIARQAVQLRTSGQFAEAVKLLREATLLDPKNADLHRELGITFLLDHEWERARVEMLEAVHRDPESAEAHSGLAYAYEKLGNLDEALKQYRICTHLDPDDASYQRHYVEVLGDLYGRQAQGKR